MQSLFFMRTFNVSSKLQIEILKKLTRNPCAFSNPVSYMVSVGSQQSQDAVIAGARWTQQNFTGANQLVIGDSLFRITALIDASTGESNPELTAQNQACAIIASLSTAVSELKIVRSSDIMARQEFLACLNEIQNRYIRNERFRDSVQSDATNFALRKQRQGRLKLPYESAKQLSIQYLLEEIAMYLCLAKQGWLTDVYLGAELPTLAHIITGRIPDVSEHLEQRCNVSIKYKEKRV